MRARLLAAGFRSRRGSAAFALIPLLLAPLALPIGIPWFEHLAPLPALARLDYSRGPPGRFAALSDEFVARELGLPFSQDSTTLPGSRSRLEQEQNPNIVAPQRAESIPPLSNDNFARAASIGVVPYEAETRTQGAGREAGEPSGCGTVARGGSVWFRYVSRRDVGLIANTFGSNYATVLAVYQGARLDGLRGVGCDSDASGNALVAFVARAGTTYQFQVAAGLLKGGRLRFRLELQGVTQRISLASTGHQANERSSFPSISADGRYVAYFSRATNLVPQGSEACSHSVFKRPCNEDYLYDAVTRTTVPLSVSSSGRWANGPSGTPTIAARGRYVAFQSSATNLVARDTNVCLPPRPQSDGDRLPSCEDVFVRDVLQGRTERVSVSSTRAQAVGWSGNPSISADGRYVAFESDAPNLVLGDSNVCAFTRPWLGLPTMTQRYAVGPCTDVFVHDRLTGKTERVSTSSDGSQGNGASWGPSISADGRYVAFSSSASNLAPRDRNICPNLNPDSFGSSTMNCTDAFVHDRMTGTTTIVSVSSTGEYGDGHSYISPSNAGNAVSSDGRHVLFFSQAHNLPSPGSGTAFKSQAFIRDLRDGTTTLVSVSSNGEKANDVVSWNISMSPDARYVVFASGATNLVPGDHNNNYDVFVRDLVRGTTVRVSVRSSGEEGNNGSDEPVISDDGRVIAFESHATNLVDGNTSLCPDDVVFGVGTGTGSCPGIFIHVRP